jgi:hypothetical protein
MKKEDADGPSPAPAVPKPYETPRLVEYGSIAKLTQGSRTFFNDGGAGMVIMICL